LADGQIATGDVSLQIVNVTFENKDVLTVGAWVMLFWFALRYWQTHQGKTHSFMTDALSLARKDYLINHVASQTNLQYEENNGFIEPMLKVSNGTWGVDYTKVSDIVRDEHGKVRSYGDSGKEFSAIDGWKALRLKARIFILALTTKPSFGSYIVPYILFWFVVFLGVLNVFRRL
jgi:hypothetical protein